MLKIQYSQDIVQRNTFRMKVSAACVVEYDSIDDLYGLYGKGGQDVTISDLPKPVLHIGEGSNLLFTGDFPGTLLHSGIRFIRQVFPGSADASGLTADRESQERGASVFYEVGAGVPMDEFCAWAAAKDLWGPENLSHIPGEAGASAVQNVGAYGVEAKDIIYSVNCFDTVLCRTVSFRSEECGYGYRESLFKTDRKGRYIITSVVFRLSKSSGPVLGYGHLKSAVEAAAGQGGVTPSLVRDTIIGIRREKLPDVSELGSAGSFFKNPVVPRSAYEKVLSIARLEHGEGCNVPHFDAGSGFVKIPAAWLIEQCGWKGYSEGNAGVYSRQPLVIVNLTGNASPDEIISLENRIMASVKEKFDILLHPEVEHI